MPNYKKLAARVRGPYDILARAAAALVFGNHYPSEDTQMSGSASRGPGIAAYAATMAAFFLILFAVYGVLGDALPAALQDLVDALPVPLPGI